MPTPTPRVQNEGTHQLPPSPANTKTKCSNQTYFPDPGRQDAFPAVRFVGVIVHNCSKGRRNEFLIPKIITTTNATTGMVRTGTAVPGQIAQNKELGRARAVPQTWK